MVEGTQQLTARVAAGDAAAVEAFYRQYFDWMYWQARRATKRDESFCLDVVQDAVLRVIRTVKAVESDGRFRGWLRLVVQTTAFDLLRSEKRRKNREAMAGVSPVEMDSDSLQLDWLSEQISLLDPELVKIIELRFEKSWTLRRIGESLGVSSSAIDGRLRRALQRIRQSAVEDSPAMADVQTDALVEPVVEIEVPVHAAGTASAEPVFVRPQLDIPGVGDPIEENATSDIPVLQNAILNESISLQMKASAADIPAANESEDLGVLEELVCLEDEAGAYDDGL